VPDEIKPALSADEWETVHSGGEWKAKVGQPFEVSLYGGGGVDFLALPEAHLLGPDRHALAALALHRQEFGFTWEDVNLLRAWAEHWATPPDEESSFIRRRTSEIAAHVNDLAARIAALLPPEG
jgi:hypothetical protein